MDRVNVGGRIDLIPCLFSGDHSAGMWDDINRVTRKNKAKGRRNAERALYTMGCRCQELERMVRQLSERVRNIDPEHR